MKTLRRFIVILILIIISIGCDSDDDDDNNFSMEAAIHSNCTTTINFEGEDLYAYELTDQFFGTYWQIGGHPANASNEIPDLGVNIFATDDGNYEVSNSWGINQAFVYYIDENGNEYTSTDNQLVTVQFENENSRSVTFGNIEVYSAALDETLCINNCTISY